MILLKRKEIHIKVLLSFQIILMLLLMEMYSYCNEKLEVDQQRYYFAYMCSSE